jgi:hypothetical protein
MKQQEQRYVSRDLTHFAGRGKRTKVQRYRVLLEIVRSGKLRSPRRFGITEFNAKFSQREMYSFPGVCFCDIPLADLRIHTQKCGPFGIAFQKQFLLQRGASPVFYIANDSQITPDTDSQTRQLDPAAVALGIREASYSREKFFDLMVSEFDRLGRALANRAKAIPRSSSKEVLELAECATRMATWKAYLTEYVFAYCIPFYANLDDTDERHFYMEREWRVYGDVKFGVSDIERLIVPREFGKRIRTDLPEYDGQVHFLD